jgi:hypothetical protein
MEAAMLPAYDIPPHWSAEQARAVYDWLGTMREQLREHYQTRLAEQPCSPFPDNPDLDDFDIDDDMPF